MESKTVMLVNTVLMTTFICEDINGTFIAFGGDVTFWKQKKFWYFTNKFHDIKRNVGIVFFFPQSQALFQLRLFSRDIFAGFDIDESYDYIQRDT